MKSERIDWHVVSFAVLLGMFAFAVRAEIKGSDDLSGGLACEYALTINGRVLLANDDVAPGHEVKGQAYWRTREVDIGDGKMLTNDVYWTHAGEGEYNNWNGINLFDGTTHRLNFISEDGSTNVLWRLNNVLIGNAYYGNSLRSYCCALPCSASSLGNSSYANKDVQGDRGEGGNLVLRNINLSLNPDAGATVYSPCYTNGIGTIYFDALNMVRADTTAQATNYSIVVEIATQTDEGLPPTDANAMGEDGSDFGNISSWTMCEMLPLKRDGNTSTFDEQSRTDTLALGITTGGTSDNFYRVCVPVNYRGPVRFRIRRVGYYPEYMADEMPGLVMLDNIIVSYSGSYASMSPYGKYDSTRGGNQVLGQEGAMANVPFPSVSDAGTLLARGRVETYVGPAESADPASFVQSAVMHYRWRTLGNPQGQSILGEWKAVALDPDNGYIAAEPLDVPTESGDIEFWYELNTIMPFYRYHDYSGTGAELGNLYTEEVKVITNRMDTSKYAWLSSGGRDWFVRLRNGASDWEDVSVVLSGAYAARLKMELVADHTWRGLVKVPKTLQGDKVSFFFVGSNRQTAGSAYFLENETAWYPTVEIEAMPFAGVVSVEGMPRTYNANAAVDWVEFTYNDLNGSFSIFEKRETEVMVQTFADMEAWTPLKTEDLNWNELFFLSNYLDPGYPKGVTFSMHKMPCLWNGDNGMFVDAALTTSAAANRESGIAWQMRGEGLGDLKYTQSEGPSGLDTISFQAHLAQSISFDDFSVWNGDGSSSTNNYTLIVPALLSDCVSKNTWPIKDYDFAPGATMSVVGYYRPMVGCYEVRVECNTSDEILISIYKWYLDKYRIVSEILAQHAFSKKNFWSRNDKSNVNLYKPNMYAIILSLGEEDGKTTIIAGLGSNDYGPADSYFNRTGASRTYNLVCYEDGEETRHRCGTYGVLSANCNGQFLYPRQWSKNVAKSSVAVSGSLYSFYNNKAIAQVGTCDLTACRHRLATEWAYTPGRTQCFTNAAYNLRPNVLGIRPPSDLSQGVQVYLKSRDADDASWMFITNVDVDVKASCGYNFSQYSVAVRTNENCHVMLKAGEEPIDVTIWDVKQTSWNGEDIPNIDNLPNDYVYTQARIMEEKKESATNRYAMLQPARAVLGKALSIRSPILNGLGKIVFSYKDVKPGCEVWVQAATNSVADNLTGTLGYNFTTNSVNLGQLEPIGSWITLRKYTYDELVAASAQTCYCGWHACDNVPLVGVFRIVVAPSVVASAQGHVTVEPEWGSITITDIAVCNEPIISDDEIVDAVVSYGGIYDGEGHAISVVSRNPNALVRYSRSFDGPYFDTPMRVTNATEHAIAVWYTVEVPNYTTITNLAYVYISPKTLKDDMVTMEDVAYVCDGMAKEPLVTVKDGDPSIITENDYEVSYADNINIGTNTAKVIVTGKGNYTGAVTNFFSILPPPEIRNVAAKQRWPWNGKVDITYEVVGDIAAGLPEWNTPVLVVSATNRVAGTNYVADVAAISGDTGVAEGKHHVVWDLNAQGLEIVSDDVVFTVRYNYHPKYCVVDLSAGLSASSYPVSYLADVPGGGWSDEYKTEKLVLRLIEPGTFMMGGTISTTLTKPFYIGVFEVTQKQYELVTGSNPCSSTSYGKGDAHPVHYVSYDMIRGPSAGAGWPGSSAVDYGSFLGKIRSRTGLSLDLPTEAQWEYACRAGTTTTYSYGNDANGDYMWYSDNSSSTSHTVGTKLPNVWGLYDMHGNVWEWTLDWYGTLAGGNDPKGVTSGSSRVLRCGCWINVATYCTSSYRNCGYPSGSSNASGFRLCCSARVVEVVVLADSAVTFIDSRADGNTVLEAKDSEPIRYSSLWAADANATATVMLNGAPFASGNGEGVKTWTPAAAGTYTFQHTTEGSGETLTATFNVAAKDIALARVAVDCRDVTYSGAAFTPPIQSVIWGEKTLVEDADYTLAYSGNVNVGTATIMLTGINLYDGTYTTNFTIRPRPLTQGMVGAIGNHPYTGKAQTPKPTVTDAERGATLSEGVEYTLSYANNTAIGEGIVTVTGKGNYTGSVARAFVIEPSAGSELEERFGGAGKAESDGEGGWIVTLTNEVDAANLPIEIPDDLGNVTIDLNGHDLIGGGGMPAIVIVPGDEEGGPTQLTIVTSGGDAIVQGGEGAPAIKVADGVQEGVLVNIGADIAVQGGGVPAIDGTIGENNGSLVKVEVPVPAVQGKEYTGSQLQADISATERYMVQNEGGVDVGNYPVTLTLADNVNYRWAGGDSNPTTITFTVTKATNEWITEPSIAGWTYGDVPGEPNMGAAKFGTATVTYGALGTERPTEAGDYTATFTVAGTDNYAGLSKSVDFTIERKSIEGAAVTLGPTLVYNGVEQTQAVTGVKIDEFDATFDVSGNLATTAGAHTLTVTGTGNFTGAATKQFTISPKTLTDAMVTLEIVKYVYDGAAKTPAVTVADGDPSIIAESDYEISYADNINIGTNTAKVIVSGKGNYTGAVTNFFSILLPPELRNVTARQRWPWNGKVDITCNVFGIEGTGSGLKFTVSAIDLDSSVTNTASHLWVVRNGTNSNYLVVRNNGDYRLVWDAQADLGEVRCSNMVVRVALEEYDSHGKVQLWKNGPYWATTNIGANKPWDRGYYFWWGDTIGYKCKNNTLVASDDSSSDFSFSSSNTPTYNKSIDTLMSEGWTTAGGLLAPAHDAAHKHWSGGWHIPTKQDLDDLNSKCGWTWTTTNGVNGYIVRGRGEYAAASIFLPAASCVNSNRILIEDPYSGAGYFSSNFNVATTYGAYWSSKPTGDNLTASLHFNSEAHNTGYNGSTGTMSMGYRHIGHTIRPVVASSVASVVPAELASDSAPFLLDTRTGVRESGGMETLTYSALWDGDANATVTIAQDGVALAEELTGEGEQAWNVQKAGAYTLTHTTYKNGVAGKVESATFNVAAKDIALARVAVDCRDVTYSGTAFAPPIQSVICGERTLVEGSDFTLAYSRNVDAGTATIMLTGINLYDGTYTTNFTIRPKMLTEGMVEAIGNHPYTGKAQTPKPTVTDVERGTTLSEGVEYTLSYANNTAIGEGIVTVTGKGNYTGSVARAFVIEPSARSELEERFGGAGKAESDGAGGWIVASTNDVDAANLPIEIPDDLGNVTIDLNGHDLVGGDGDPAIRIVPGHDEGGPTQLTIVTSGGDATVQGGEGSPAIEVVGGTQDGVIINIGDGVTVQGGGVPAIDGTIGENNGTLVKVEVPVPAIASKEHTGVQQQADITATEFYAVQNDGGVNAGNYPVTLTLTDEVNYRWSGGDSNPTTITFSVTKATNAWITEPSIAGWTYGDAPSEPNMGAAKFGTATVTYGALGTERPAEAGGYTATFTVVGTDNYAGLSQPVDFTIAKRPVAVAVVGHTTTYVYDTTEKSVAGYDATTEDALYDIAADTAFRGGIIDAALPSVARTDVGVTMMGLTVADFANNNANFDVTYAVTDGWIKISSTKELDELAESFGGLPVAITPDSEGGWIVTITNDIDSADLPIEIPDNIGNVTIDLNGHNLVGGNGEPVIQVVPGEGEGEPTEIAIVNSGEDATVVGGEGAPAIEVAEDAQDGVLINIGEGVTVQGGDDYTPAIIGEVGTNEGTIVKPSRIHVPGEGAVTTPKSWNVGQKVTWKAKAEKGSVFAHWEGELVDSLGLSRNELRNPSLAFTVPKGFDASQITAVFIALDDDGLSKLSFVDGEGKTMGDEGVIFFELKADVGEFWLVDNSESYVTASVSGLPSGLKFDKKTLRITGTPTKSGAYWVQIKAKNASGYQWAEKVKMVVPGYTTEPKEPKLTQTAYYPLTVISSDTAAGTASGTGVYADGKKASISAKPAKNYVFAGWYRDAELTEPMQFASGDYRKTSQSVVVPEVRYLFARFVAATTAADPVKDLAAVGSGLTGESKFSWRVGVAVPEGDGVEYASASLPSASAAKLPPGVKFDAAKGRFTGVPTKAGSYTATVTVKNASKATATLTLTIDVAALDEWAQGTFNGAVMQSDGHAGRVTLPGGGFIETALPSGLVTLTVAANGKIGGKILEGGKTWSLSAVSFSRVEHVERVGNGLAYYATVVAKSGKEVATNEIAIVAEAIEAAGAAAVSSKPPYRGFATGTLNPIPHTPDPKPYLSAWQNQWKVEPWKALAKPFAKVPAVTTPDGVTLKFASSGAVTAKLGTYSCSSVLIPCGGGSFATFVYFPPKSGKFDGYAAEIPLLWDGEKFRPVTRAFGIDYYVSAATGDDSNDGKSVDAAFRTIDAALSAASARQSVAVLEGEYPYPALYSADLPLDYGAVGADKSVTLVALDGREKTVIDKSLTEDASAARVVGCVTDAWTRFEHFTFRGCRLVASKASRSQFACAYFKDCVFEGMDTSNRTTSAMFLSSVLDGCEVRDLRIANYGGVNADFKNINPSIFMECLVTGSGISFSGTGGISLAQGSHFEDCAIAGNGLLSLELCPEPLQWHGLVPEPANGFDAGCWNCKIVIGDVEYPNGWADIPIHGPSRGVYDAPLRLTGCRVGVDGMEVNEAYHVSSVITGTAEAGED